MLLLACAGSAPRAAPSMPPEGATTGIPALPFSPANTLSRVYDEALHPTTLRPPRGVIEVWARDVLGAWMTNRSTHLANARDLRRALREHPFGPTITSGLFAILLEDTAEQLRNLDLPDNLSAEVQAPVPSLERQALQAYEVCHEQALEAGTAVDGWHRFCGQGIATLQERVRAYQ